MKLNRILAGMSAAAMAASMLTMVTSAADEASTLKVGLQAVGWAEFSGETTVNGDGAYSITVNGISAADGLTNVGFFSVTEGEADVVATVDTITVNGDYTVTVDTEIDTASTTGNGLANIWNPNVGKPEGVAYAGEGCSFVGDGGTSIKFMVGADETEVTSLTYNITVGSGTEESSSEESSDTSSETEEAAGYELPADYIANNKGFLLGDAEKGEAGPFSTIDNLVACTGIEYTISIDETLAQSAIAGDTWIGLAAVWNADTCGWTANECALQPDAKPYTFVKVSDGVYKVTIPAPEGGIFNAADTFANVELQDWSGAAEDQGIVLTGVKLLGVEAPSDEPVPTPETEYVAFEVFTDSAWGWGNWLPFGVEKEDGSDIGKGTDAAISEDGTYTVSVEAEKVAKFYDADGNEVPAGTEGATVAPATGVTVWCVDIIDFAAALGCGSADLPGSATAADKMALVNEAGISFSDVSLIIDGETVYTYDDADLLYGDIEGNGNLRLEILNAYGESGDAKDDNYNAPAEVAALATDLTASESVAVTFTINGIPKDLPKPPTSSEESSDPEESSEPEESSKPTDSEKPADSDKDSDGDKDGDKNPSTGAAALATVGVLLAGAAVVATKKK